MHYLSKRAGAFFALPFLLLSSPLFAQGGGDALTKLNTLAGQILEFFKSPLVKTIMIIVLCASALAFAVNKDNRGLRAGCIAVIIALGIILVAQGVMDALWVF